MSDNAHKGHRQRMYNRYITSPDTSFADHELIEMLLYGPLKRVNTNTVAHDLISHFGSLDAVFDADIDALTQVNGINTASAVHIKLTASIWRRYMALKSEKSSPSFDRNVIGNMLVNSYRMIQKEVVTLLMFDQGGKLITTKTLSEGSMNAAGISPRRIAELSLSCSASYIALAHNHPHGKAEPSDEDITTTRLIKRSLDMIELHLIELFIIAGEEFCTLFS